MIYCHILDENRLTGNFLRHGAFHSRRTRLIGDMPLMATGFPDEASFSDNTQEKDAVIPGEGVVNLKIEDDFLITNNGVLEFVT